MQLRTGAPERQTALNGCAAYGPHADEPALRRFALCLLNEAFATEVPQIRVGPVPTARPASRCCSSRPADAKAGASIRGQLQVERGRALGLIERHVSLGSDANFVNAAVEVEVARGATVQHYRVQQTGARATWFDTLKATLAENARYQQYMRASGRPLGALDRACAARGANAEVGICGASVGGKNQVHDTYALVEHVAPNALSEQIFRGIAAGRARVAFNGKVMVRTGAHGSDSRQSLRGLLAGAEAEIDVRPQLEIHTDDVRCSHGATAGKLDEKMLFYLLSRGLDRETAQRLLKWAFLADVVGKIDVPELRRQIERSLAGQLNEAAALKGAPYTAHGQWREQLPRTDGERAVPAQKELL